MTVTEELTFIMKKNGGLLDPVHVVNYAKRTDTALHSKFCWDDSEAAEQYRLWQARQIIRLELTILPQKKSEPVRLFVSLAEDRHGDEERGYRTITSVLKSTHLREQLLDEARRDMILFKRKYQMLQELAGVFEAMSKI